MVAPIHAMRRLRLRVAEAMTQTCGNCLILSELLESGPGYAQATTVALGHALNRLEQARDKLSEAVSALDNEVEALS